MGTTDYTVNVTSDINPSIDLSAEQQADITADAIASKANVDVDVVTEEPKVVELEKPIAPQPTIQDAAAIQTADQASAVAQQKQITQTKVRGLFRIEEVAEELLWLKAMIYGSWGAGKTTLAATADEVPHLKDVLFINAESGTLSLRQRFPKLNSIRINNFSQFARIHDFLRLHTVARDADDIEKLKKLEAITFGVTPESIGTPKKYRTLIVDSLSEVQRYCMMQMMGVSLEQVQLDYPPDSPGYQQWGQTGEQIQTLVRVLRDLPMNVIFICSQKEEQDEAKRYHFKPNLPGKLAGNVQGFFDVVGYLTMVTLPSQDQKTFNYVRRLFLTPTPFFDAKNRIGNKTSFIDDPTIEKLLACN